MMLRLLFISTILLNLLLSGCATSSENTGIARFQGQPLNNLTNKVGSPDNQGAQGFYTWEHTELITITRGGEETAFTRTTVAATCRLTTETDGSNVISKVTLEGHYDVCDFFRSKLM